MREAELYQLLESTGDAAFVVDDTGTICFWNTAAERLLAIPAAQALHKSCAYLMDGCDPGGAPLCMQDCAILELARRNDRVRDYDLHVKRGSGTRMWVNVSIIVARAQGKILTAHLLRDIDEKKRLQTVAHDIMDYVGRVSGPNTELAPREREAKSPTVELTTKELRVLQLLALGRSTERVARDLDVATTTVRNHVQHILHKLRVHTRLEAVIRAAREGMI